MKNLAGIATASGRINAECKYEHVDVARMTHLLQGIQVNKCEENFRPARVTLCFAVRIKWLVIFMAFLGFRRMPTTPPH